MADMRLVQWMVDSFQLYMGHTVWFRCVGQLSRMHTMHSQIDQEQFGMYQGYTAYTLWLRFRSAQSQEHMPDM